MISYFGRVTTDMSVVTRQNFIKNNLLTQYLCGFQRIDMEILSLKTDDSNYKHNNFNTLLNIMLINKTNTIDN